MKNRNTAFTAIAFALAFGIAAVTEAVPSPGGGPTTGPANYQPSAEGEQLSVITIHSAGDIPRGKIGSFVLGMKPAILFGGTFVNFKVSGTAVAGVDYVSLLSPAYIGQSGYGVISVATLPDLRGSSFRKTYSVVITLEPGLGYALGEPKSAQLTIK
jgi:hypothetical protein